MPTARLFGNLGDLLQGRVPLAEVEPLYRRAVAIFDRLAKSDPGNGGWQRNLSVAFNKIGAMMKAVSVTSVSADLDLTTAS